MVWKFFVNKCPKFVIMFSFDAVCCLVVDYVADELFWEEFELGVDGQVVVLAVACPFGGHFSVVDFVDFCVEILLGLFSVFLN